MMLQPQRTIWSANIYRRLNYTDLIFVMGSGTFKMYILSAGKHLFSLGDPQDFYALILSPFLIYFLY